MAALYTGRGDSGETDVGAGRQRKDAPALEAVGSLDEANAAIGAALAELAHGGPGERSGVVRRILLDVQADLFALSADLAWPASGVALAADRVAWLEQRIDEAEAALPPLASFVLPGGCRAAASLHLARTAVRLAERRVVALLAPAPEQPATTHPALPYLNRLSDLLFAQARLANRDAGVDETPWSRPDRQPAPPPQRE